MKKYKKWKIEELNYIEKNFKKIKDKDLVSAFNKKFSDNITIDMLRRQRRKIGAVKKRGRFTDDYSYVIEETKDEKHIRTDCVI